MQFSEFHEAVQDAEQTMRLADRAAAMMVRMLVGRLRKVNAYHDRWYLGQLKKELRDFNASTRTWKDE